MEIINESDVKYFINKLPELNSVNVSHLIMLAIKSRRIKEFYGFKLKDLVVETKVIRPISDWKTRYFDSINNFALLQNEGRYTYKEVVVPKEAKAIYATVNLRDNVAALNDLSKENLDNIFKLGTSSKLEALTELNKQPRKFFSKLHKHKHKSTNFVTIDIDYDAEELIKVFLDILSPLPIWMVTKTIRGYHIILDLNKSEDAKEFYVNIKGQLDKYADKFDFCRDAQEPVAGTLVYDNKGNSHYITIIQ